MSTHTDLPIHRECADLFGVTIEIIKVMPRNIRNLIGNALTARCESMLTAISLANTAIDPSERSRYIRRINMDVDVFNVWLRNCRESRAISTDLYAKGTKITASIGRQATGWRKSTTSSPVASSSRR